MSTAATGRALSLDAVIREKDRKRKCARMQYLAQQFRLTVLDILHEKGTGHWGGAASAAEILTALYFDAMNIRPEEPAWPGRDRLVVSKGHASCMLYTILALASDPVRTANNLIFILIIRYAKQILPARVTGLGDILE